ncbi:unnamed protein product [Camellia sinensis]
MVLDVQRVRAMAIDIAKMPLINRAKGEMKEKVWSGICTCNCFFERTWNPTCCVPCAHYLQDNSWFVAIMEQNKHQGIGSMEVIFALRVYLDLDLLGMGFFDSMVLDVPRVRAMAIDIAKMPFGVESAPAIVFLKEHGIKHVHVVYHDNSWFVAIMEQNKHQELPQLRSVTSMELGCDACGYSHVGNETAICYETCGPRRDIIDVPQLIIPKNMVEAFLNDDVDPASLLVVRYNGSEESSEVVPEDADPIWCQTILSKGTGMKQRIGSTMNGIHNHLGDLRIGKDWSSLPLGSIDVFW